MGNFLIFVFVDDAIKGGMKDYVTSYNDHARAMEWIDENVKRGSSYHIYDLLQMKIVREGIL